MKIVEQIRRERGRLRACIMKARGKNPQGRLVGSNELVLRLQAEDAVLTARMLKYNQMQQREYAEQIRNEDARKVMLAQIAEQERKMAAAMSKAKAKLKDAAIRTA